MKNIVIITERLELREFDPSEAKFYFDLNNDPEVMRYTGDVPFNSVEEAKLFLENYDHYDLHGFGRWSVYLRDSEILLGWCGLKQLDEETIDLGYRFFRKYWNKGYATEAAQACIKYGFLELKLNQIVGRTAKENKASVKVLEKVGMNFWKEAPCEGIENSIYYRIENSNH